MSIGAMMTVPRETAGERVSGRVVSMEAIKGTKITLS